MSDEVSAEELSSDEVLGSLIDELDDGTSLLGELLGSLDETDGVISELDDDGAVDDGVADCELL